MTISTAAAPGGLSIQAAFGMPPEDAVAYFASKGYAITFDWRDMWQEAHTQAFTVASVARMDVLADIRTALDTALKEGKTAAWFREQLEPALKEKGWWGNRIDVAPDGTAQKVAMGSPARLNLIYRQNMQTAYNAGRYKQQLESADTHPWWEYIAVNDQRTRPHHAALHGTVLRWDDPFWDSFYPPNDWGCRCRVNARSDASIGRDGITPLESKDRLIERTVETVRRDTGEVEERTVRGMRLPDGREVFTGTGFSYNPGKAAIGADMEVARKLSLVRDINLKAQAIQGLNNSPLRQERFAADVDRVLDARRAGKGALVAGFVDDTIATFVRAKGEHPATVLALPEKRLLHADSTKHQAKGTALTRAQYKAIPAMIARPEQVLWDTVNRNVVYVYPGNSPAEKIKIVVDMPARPKDAKYIGRLDAVINAYTVPAPQLRGAQYELIR